MRVDGQPRFSSAVIIIANVVNIILDFTFLYYFKMGVGGASLASFIGEVVALLFITKYYFDPKRTFRFIYSIPLRKWINSLVGIVKTGFPSASMGLFDVVLVYIMNRILIGVLSTTGLVAYSVSVDALLLISILIIGVADTITSIIPFIPFLMTVFSALRLARFNLDERQATSFIGLPTSANGLFWAALLYDPSTLTSDLSALSPSFILYLILALVLLFSWLLVSPIPIFSMKFHNLTWRDNYVRYIFLAVSIVLIILLGIRGGAAVIGWYIVLSLLTNKVEKSKSQRV